MINFRRWRRALYRRVVRLPGTADSVARGAAVGVIAGCVMPPGLQLVVGIPIALLVRGSMIAMIAFSFVSNPVTYLPLYIFTCRVGQLFLNLCGSDVRLGSELADMVRQAASQRQLSRGPPPGRRTIRGVGRRPTTK